MVVQQILSDKFPVSLQVAVIGLVLAGVFYAVKSYLDNRPLPGFPVIKLDGLDAQKTWLFQGNRAITEGIRRFNGPFQVMTGTGPKILLPNRYANEIKNIPQLSLDKAFSKDLYTHYRGFEGLREGLGGSQIIQDTIKTRLTPSLGLVISDMVDETAAALPDIFTDVDKSNFVSRVIRDDIEHLVARLTSRVFLGESLCRNERWLEISKSYTIDAVVLSNSLRTVFPLFQPIAYWFFPEATRLRQAIRDAHALIDPEVERRKAIVEEAHANGEKPPRVADTLGWMYELSKNRHHTNYVAGQLTLAFASINNTVEVLSAALMDVCEYPDAADKLRQEIVEVIGKQGWTKASLFDLKLMDSFLREGQRVHPGVSISMQRGVEKETVLSDGTILPKNSRIMVAGECVEPGTKMPPFDAERFVKLRDEGDGEKGYQFVTPGPEYMSFGYGRHACPGRFLASNELKVALCHLLMKYEWRFVPGEERRPPLTMEATNMLQRDVKVQMRQREPEFDVDAVDFTS